MNVKSPNNTSKWQMGFNSAFKGLIECAWGAVRGAKIFILTRPSTLALGISDCRGLCVYGKNASSPENYNTLPSSDEVKNVWGSISTLQDCMFKSLIAEIFVHFFLETIETFEEFL
jgi:hypothetical protein